ncbi:energy-coupling factor ABC transporter permease [Varunaivibrio sulfuroxidans]|nr:energy-coupling factor ABC transporter permease [Varunaivibrio sulfuroxidans]
MHIEPGFVTPVKVAMANVGALAIAGWALKEHIKISIKNPWSVAKPLVAAVFFTLFMQSFHMQVGPSELHFVGAMAMYLTLGFIPTLLGFAIGLLLQGLVFSPWDLVNLGVNSLSLIVPLLAVHYGGGRRYFAGGDAPQISWARIVKLDAMYYSGVTAMVGFWLTVGGGEAHFMAWLKFASSYLVLVALEPVFTWTIVKGLKKIENSSFVSRLFAVRELNIAGS